MGCRHTSQLCPSSASGPGYSQPQPITDDITDCEPVMLVVFTRPLDFPVSPCPCKMGHGHRARMEFIRLLFMQKTNKQGIRDGTLIHVCTNKYM